MQDFQLYWNIVRDEAEEILYKHCKNCGKTVVFKDTLIRRHNANGKNIYRYAIYKCEKDHTWNQKLSVYKTYTDHVKVYDTKEEKDLPKIEEMNLEWNKLMDKGKCTISITIQNIIGNKHRIDKTLAERIPDLSRSQIVQRIRDHSILVNRETCKPSQTLMKDAIITIKLK